LTVHFFLPLEPFSVNRTYSRDKRFKTSAFKAWEIAAFEAIGCAEPQRQLKELREFTAGKTFVYSVEFAFHCPRLITKSGTISNQVEDLSNVEKPLLDVLFLPKVHIQLYPYGVKNVNCDDRYVTKLVSSKQAADKPGVWITITANPLSS
jgi:hypothetical protein